MRTCCLTFYTQTEQCFGETSLGGVPLTGFDSQAGPLLEKQKSVLGMKRSSLTFLFLYYYLIVLCNESSFLMPSICFFLLYKSISIA